MHSHHTGTAHSLDSVNKTRPTTTPKRDKKGKQIYWVIKWNLDLWTIIQEIREQLGVFLKILSARLFVSMETVEFQLETQNIRENVVQASILRVHSTQPKISPPSEIQKTTVKRKWTSGWQWINHLKMIWNWRKTSKASRHHPPEMKNRAHTTTFELFPFSNS